MDREVGHGSTTIARTVSMSVDRISSVLERLEWLVVLCLPRGKWTQNVEHIPPPSVGYLATPLLRPVCSRFVVGRWGRSSLCHKCIPSGGGQPIARYKREASCESVCERGTDFLSSAAIPLFFFFSFFLFFQSRFLAPFSRDLIVVCRCELKLVT